VAQLLSAAASEAVRLEAERLIWPVRLGEDFDAVARVTETVQLVQQLVELGHDHSLRVETPLLEMTMTEAVEAGHQMQVPWELARSCRSRQQKPCGRCEGCRARRDAFNELGLVDPLRGEAA
jgi:7-cyano-7-deazaguanine synthase